MTLQFLIKSGYYIVPSPSTALIKGLQRRLPDTFSLVVSHTTREPRKEMRCDTYGHHRRDVDHKCEVEIDGVDYHFTDRITMTTAIEKGT